MPAPKAADRGRWRAGHVEALRLGRALQAAATVFRRYAGNLKYQPQTGVAGPVGDDLLRAAATMRETLASITSVAARWDEEITWMRSLDPTTPVDDLQRGHAAAREAARLVRAALDLFDRAIGQPEVAPLDAPYGTGAPKRVHPGAQCTWVAERAEALARELGNATLGKENLLLGMRREA